MMGQTDVQTETKIQAALRPLVKFLCLGVFASLCGRAAEIPVAAGEIAAVVNGTEIPQSRIDLYLKSEDRSQAPTEQTRKQALEVLIDRTLIAQLLESRGVTAPSATLDRQLAIVERVLQTEDDPAATLENMGITREQLQAQLALPLAWARYVRQVITEPMIAEYFKKHRSELDGSKRQAAQIFLKLGPAATAPQTDAAIAKLAQIRTQIESGEMTFAQAAREHSQAPSAQDGGDIGQFAFHGQMPAKIAKQTFSTPVGEMSQPFVTQFGAHLILCQKQIPGLYSLEDARPDILRRMGDELWAQTVQKLRRSARIKYLP